MPGNLLVRFDEGRVGRYGVTLSPTLLVSSTCQLVEQITTIYGGHSCYEPNMLATLRRRKTGCFLLLTRGAGTVQSVVQPISKRK
jgi:hypothetical protein